MVIHKILAPLLELNRQRAEEERLSGTAAERKTDKSRKLPRVKSDADQPGLS